MMRFLFALVNTIMLIVSTLFWTPFAILQVLAGLFMACVICCIEVWEDV